jgi:hypothetical protein
MDAVWWVTAQKDAPPPTLPLLRVRFDQARGIEPIHARKLDVHEDEIR